MRWKNNEKHVVFLWRDMMIMMNNEAISCDIYLHNDAHIIYMHILLILHFCMDDHYETEVFELTNS